MKTVWISALKEDQARVSAVMDALKRYGLKCAGHFWADVPDKLSWRLAVGACQEAKADMWLVLIDSDQIKKSSVRYGLSLMATALRSESGKQFPIATLWNTAPPADHPLPQLMASAQMIEESNSAWAAKIVAKINAAAKPLEQDHRLDVLGDERLGQWFEISPMSASWDGVIFGVAGLNCEITFQAVGPSGMLPEKATLEYAQEGLRIEAIGREFVAWAVANQVGAGLSYYARVKGLPDALLFMPNAPGSGSSGDAEQDEVSATIVRLT
jgi:hypothetical protein